MNIKMSTMRRAAALLLATIIGLALTDLPSAQAATPKPDGLTEATAAASCWEVKQNYPSSADGVYWLETPKLGAPEKFYCDQTTDGGGWVLIGRGRQGWSESNMGKGTAAEVRDPVTGQSAFSPKQLTSQTIEGLLNGESVNSLDDGIRLHRATDTSGTSWQDFSFKLSSPRDTWTWEFYNQQRVKNYSVNGTTRSSSDYTSDFGADNNLQRVTTTTTASQGWEYGFGFGRNARGSSDASSYIWGSSSSMVNPRPFTQVYLRPKLMSSDVFTTIPDTGTAAITNAPNASSFALPTVWGVAGLGAGPSSIEGSNEVSAFAEVGDVIYVGGNFTSVQKSAGGASKVDQSYLAAFNRDTGELISSFNPTFNNQIKALAAMPDGRLAVGGYFSEVDGQPRAGLAVLNATTGELDPNFTGGLFNYLSGQTVAVRGLDVQGDWLYVGGAFTHSTGGTYSGQAYTRGAARFSVSDGTPDPGWNPELNGTVLAVDASSHGDRTYVSGYFTESKGKSTTKAAALNTTNADAFTWQVHLSSSVAAGYQEAIKEVGNRIWVGGSEHSLFSYDRTDFSLLSTTVGQRGGDFQTIASDGTTVFGGCHCFDAEYSGASTWPSIGTDWTSAERIYAAGAWSAETGKIKPDFSPDLNTRAGAGAWSLFVDSSGTLWEGGDISYSTRSGYVRQWSGGFARFPAVDTVAPSTPTDVSAVSSGGEVTVSWDASSGAPSGYEVLRDDRVVATTDDTSVKLDLTSTTSKYFVRAVDAAGNRSASSAAVTAHQGVATQELISTGSTWKYLYNGEGPGSGWTTQSYDDSSWVSGTAPLGWGQSSLGTTLTSSETPKPIASFYRKTVNIPSVATVSSMTITTRADDGVIVYVNGTEVGRKNMTAGTSGPSDFANAAVSASSAVANPVEFDVPTSDLQDGDNVIAVEVHSNYRSTPSHSFELSASATLGTP